MAEGKKVAELDAELKVLVKRWEDAIANGYLQFRSSAAEYLTYVASGGDQQDSVEMRYEEEKTVSQADQKIQNTLWELEKSYDILDSACKKRSSEMAQCFRYVLIHV